MHILSERVILEDLKAAGLVQGDVDEMIKVQGFSLFLKNSKILAGKNLKYYLIEESFLLCFTECRKVAR